MFATNAGEVAIVQGLLGGSSPGQLTALKDLDTWAAANPISFDLVLDRKRILPLLPLIDDAGSAVYPQNIVVRTDTMQITYESSGSDSSGLTSAVAAILGGGSDAGSELGPMKPILVLFFGHWFSAAFFQSLFLHRYAAHRPFSLSPFWERALQLMIGTPRSLRMSALIPIAGCCLAIATYSGGALAQDQRPPVRWSIALDGQLGISSSSADQVGLFAGTMLLSRWSYLEAGGMVEAGFGADCSFLAPSLVLGPATGDLSGARAHLLLNLGMHQYSSCGAPTIFTDDPGASAKLPFAGFRAGFDVAFGHSRAHFLFGMDAFFEADLSHRDVTYTYLESGLSIFGPPPLPQLVTKTRTVGAWMAGGLLRLGVSFDMSPGLLSDP